MTYLPDDPHPGGKYVFCYSQLRDDYRRFALMSDREFLAHIIDVLHFTVYACYVKELQTQWTCADTGIIHEVVHLVCEERNKVRGDEDFEVSTTSLEKIRDLFNEQCCFA